MNKNNYIDTGIKRKKNIVNDAFKLIEGQPMPSVVEISESGTCNRKCIFCPRSAPDFPDVKEFISPTLIKKLAEELSEFDYSGIVLFSGFVEPMLDKNIYDHIETIGAYLPHAKIELVTNGDALDVSRLKKLFQSGLSTILISVYDGADDANRFTKLCADADLTRNQFLIRHRYLPEEQSFGITINNRSGMMANAEYSIPALNEPIKAPCYYPHYTFFMDYLGDVLMCPHDWGKKKILGNLLKSSFAEIWLSKQFMTCRTLLSSGNRNMSPCNLCDVNGGLMGEHHAKKWDLSNGAVNK